MPTQAQVDAVNKKRGGSAAATPQPTAPADPAAPVSLDDLKNNVAQLEADLMAARQRSGGQVNGEVQKFKDLLNAARGALQRETERQVQDKTSGLSDQLDPFAQRSPAEQAAYESAIGVLDPSTLQQYGVNDPRREVGQNELIDAQSIDPSLFQSSWEGDKSAFGDVGYSKDALGRMGQGRDYYGDLMKGGGRDAASEAEYGRRTADAEQVRRAQTDAALAAEEARGGSSAGARVLAEQAASSGQINDMYRAGLDANAMAQQRRDAAAGKYYDLSKGIGDTQFGADFDVAGGLDAFKASKNSALDNVAAQNAQATQQGNIYNADSAAQAGMYNAGQYTNAADANTQRDWYTNDANVDTANQTSAGNAAARAAGTGAYQGSLGLEGGQTLGQGGLDLSRSQFEFQKSQAPTPFERGVQLATPFVGAGAGLLGNVYRPPQRKTG